jgi:hypothetical protein
MPTNSQRNGTRNLTANLPEDYLGELGKEAFSRFNNCRSRLVVTALEFWAAAHDPALALRLKEIRRKFYGAALLAVFMGTLFAHDSLRRAARVRREIVSANYTN